MKKLIFAALLFAACSTEQSNEERFEKINNSPEWALQMDDSCRGDWQAQWFMDGKIATVVTSEEGMNFTAGPEFGNDAHHAVLWTKESFEGDVKIEYNYTRTDNQTINVNILYIQAQGVNGRDADISKWNELRETPTMKIYYEYMNPLHISYAAFPMVNDDPTDDYLRIRKYPISDKVSFDQMEVEPTYFKIGLFQPFVTYKVTVIKDKSDLYMTVEGDGRKECYIWSIADKAPLTEGRIGLRHMYTRSAQYSDFKVFTK